MSIIPKSILKQPVVPTIAITKETENTKSDWLSAAKNAISSSFSKLKKTGDKSPTLTPAISVTASANVSGMSVNIDASKHSSLDSHGSKRKKVHFDRELTFIEYSCEDLSEENDKAIVIPVDKEGEAFKLQVSEEMAEEEAISPDSLAKNKRLEAVKGSFDVLNSKVRRSSIEMARQAASEKQTNTLGGFLLGSQNVNSSVSISQMSLDTDTASDFSEAAGTGQDSKLTPADVYRFYLESLQNRRNSPIDAISSYFKDVSLFPQVLDFSGTFFNSSNFRSFLDFLSLKLPVQEIRFDNCQLDNESLKSILLTLLNYSKVPKLAFVDNRKLNDTAFKQLAVFIKKADWLSYLDLSGVVLDKKATTYLGHVLSNRKELSSEIYTSSLSELCLNRCSLDDAAFSILADGVQHSKLAILKLQGNKLKNISGEHVGRMLTGNPALLHLDLSSNEIANGVTSIGKALISNQFLTSLNLSNTKIDAESFKLFSISLKENKILKDLNVSGNEISTGMSVFHQAMSSNTSLRTLNISNTKLDTKGAYEVGGWITKNTKLKTLVMSGNDLGISGVQQLAKCVSSNQKLVKLDILPVLNCNESRLQEYLIVISKTLNDNIAKQSIVPGAPVITVSEFDQPTSSSKQSGTLYASGSEFSIENKSSVPGSSIALENTDVSASNPNFSSLQRKAKLLSNSPLAKAESAFLIDDNNSQLSFKPKTDSASKISSSSHAVKSVMDQIKTSLGSLSLLDDLIASEKKNAQLGKSSLTFESVKQLVGQFESASTEISQVEPLMDEETKKKFEEFKTTLSQKTKALEELQKAQSNTASTSVSAQNSQKTSLSKLPSRKNSNLK